MLKLWSVSIKAKSKTKKNILMTDFDFTSFLSEQVMNVLTVVVPINNTENHQFETEYESFSIKKSAVEK